MRRIARDPLKEKAVVDLIKASEEAKKSTTVTSLPSSGVDLKDLLNKTRTILYREITNLMQESSAGLLSKDSSQSLTNYIKLLKDLIKEENALFDNMSDEELEKIVKKENE